MSASLVSAQGDRGSGLEARLSRVEGAVYLHVSGQPDDQFVEAQEGEELAQGDLVKTGEDGRAEITLEGPSVIDVSPNTDFTLDSLAPQDTVFGLSLGSFIAKIKKLADSQQMHFATPTAVAAVRGTELSVEAGADGRPAHVGVFDEGHVAVTAPGVAGQTELGPGQESEIRAGAAPGQPRPLSALLAGRSRLAAVRQRQQYWRSHWRARPAAQRRAMRQALMRRRFIRREQLQRRGPAIRRRAQFLQQRRQRRPQARGQGSGGPRPGQRQGAAARRRLRRQRHPAAGEPK